MPTPEEWRFDLECKLDQQIRDTQIFTDYYDGNHRMAFVTSKFREAFGEIFDTLVDNWCELIVDAPVERLGIEGFRFDGDESADAAAWKIWKANRMPSQSIMGHIEAVKCGTAFVMVGPGANGPRITVEHPAQMVVEYAAGDRTQRLAALKRWQGADGYTYTTLYLPEMIHKWRSASPSPLVPLSFGQTPVARLHARTVRSAVWEQIPGSGTNPLGMVPVWELANNPTMLGGGRSDLLPAIPLQDAINKEIADMLIASEFAAFPQRVITGVEVPTDEAGEPLEGFELKSAISRLWTFEDPETKISEFSAASLQNYVDAVTVLLQHMAAQTRTPPHYLLGQIVNASGDALKAAETGLVSKVKRKQVDFEDSWQEAMSAALQLAGKAPEASIETIWRDPEYRSEGETVDAAVKLKEIGIPFEALWERIGATPQQIGRWAVLMNLPERRSFGNPNPTNNGATPESDAKSNDTPD
jgi:hypothetical protein